jgi:DNA primase
MIDYTLFHYQMLTAILSKMQEYYARNLRENAAVIGYVRTERLISDATIEKFGIGYDPQDASLLTHFLADSKIQLSAAVDAGIFKQDGNDLFDRMSDRVVFPVYDLAGNVIAFSGRVWEKDDARAKFINTATTLIYRKSLAMFGLYQAQTKIQELGYSIIVEGNLDVITLHQAGFENAVAPCGTSVTTEQLAILKSLAGDVMLWFDNDGAGEGASLRAQKLCDKAGLRWYLLGAESELLAAKDADEFVRVFGVKPIQDAITKILEV